MRVSQRGCLHSPVEADNSLACCLEAQSVNESKGEEEVGLESQVCLDQIFTFNPNAADTAFVWPCNCPEQVTHNIAALRGLEMGYTRNVLVQIADSHVKQASK